jgi:hypothetical protein
MKQNKFFYGMAIMAMALSTVACGGGSQQEKTTGKKFAPVERQSSLTAEERSKALAEKRASLELDVNTLLDSSRVRFAIVEPIIQGDITQDIADRISMKLLHIASQNGISGVGSYNFVFGTEIAQTGRTATSTLPQKMTIQYELTFKVMNTITGDVYATATQQIMGVGNTFVEANRNAIKEIKNTPQLQQMLQTASSRIVEWYNANLQVIKNQVEDAEREHNYALALAILNSIPEQATQAYPYVAEKQGPLYDAMYHKIASDMLGEMKALMASLNDDFHPAVGAYFSLIPVDAPEHAEADRLYAEYEKKCKARRDVLEAKAERDEQAARELERLRMLYEHEESMADIEASKIRAKYEAQASAAAAKASSRPSGLFGSLGYAISGTFDRVFGAADFIGDKISDWFD